MDEFKEGEFVSHIVDVDSTTSHDGKEFSDGFDLSENSENISGNNQEEGINKSIPQYIQECKSVDSYKIIEKIEEGSYGIVYKAIKKDTKEIYALKRLKMGNQTEGFPITSIREIITLLVSKHKNIINVKELVLGHDVTKIYIVMEYVDHDLKAVMTNLRQKRRQFSLGEIKCLLLQIIEGVKCLHDNWIIHRDLKPSNLLIGNNGILKIADFGLCRFYGSPLKEFTPIVVTLYYRSPELLLNIKKYSTFVDIWSIGCIMAELYLMKPLWPCRSETEMLNTIFKDLGLISESHYPGLSEECVLFTQIQKTLSSEISKVNKLRSRFDSRLTSRAFEILSRFFDYNPHKRISAGEALKFPYFQESPQAIHPSLFPTWPDSLESEIPGSKKVKMSTPGPPEGHLMQPDFDFHFFKN